MRMPRGSRFSAVLVCSLTTVFLAVAFLVLRSANLTGSRAVLGQTDLPGSPVAKGPDEEFKPPSREELEKVRWIRRPCVVFQDHLRRALEKEPALASEKEALELENSSEEANKKILSALGRLPKDESEVDWDATFHRWLGADPASLDPLSNSSVYETYVNDLLWFLPVEPDWEFKHMGNLNMIESWETSEDHLMDRIVFRGDITWSDGEPFTAHDVEFTWKKLMDVRVLSPALRSLASGLRAVKAYDQKTVVYFQKEALVTNPLHLAWFIVPRHAYGMPSFNSAPVTCGAYRLVSWKRQEEMVFERREEWHRNAKGEAIRPKPYFKRVRFQIIPDNKTVFQAFLTGDIDDAEFDSNQWTQKAMGAGFYKTCTKARGEEWQFSFIGWNAKSNPPNPFFGDRRVRQAMTYAFKHQVLLDEMFYGLYRAGQGIFHPDSWMANKGLKPFREDPDRAEELLDEAGWKDTDGDRVRDKVIDGKKVPFQFALSVPSQGTGQRVAELLHSSLEPLGVRCDVQPIDWGVFQSFLRDRKAQAFLMGLTTGTDPDTSRNLFETKAIADGRNYVGYSNPQVDELFQKGQREFDQAKRAAIYAEIDRLIYEDHPISLLLYKPTLWGFSKSLRGYRPSPRGFYRYSPGFYSIWKRK